ncbi:MAG: hypothetical protein IJV83_05340 [Clostridia bacterium]|nr:hypothetical protein [Schwartzia sp. (in: firmicutes)]MBQ9714726.1 hypothetical protein [Clostridia bacterium]
MIELQISVKKTEYKHKNIVERLNDMDCEAAKKALWYLLQVCEKSLDCKRCPGKCERPSKGLCMMRILDEVEAMDNEENDG